jgi:hypothetical protein
VTPNESRLASSRTAERYESFSSSAKKRLSGLHGVRHGAWRGSRDWREGGKRLC